MAAIAEMDGWGPPERGAARRSARHKSLPAARRGPTCVGNVDAPELAHLAVGRWLPPHFGDAEGGPRATRPHVGGEVRGCGGKAEPCRSRRHGSRGQARARTCPPPRAATSMRTSRRRVLFTWSRSNAACSPLLAYGPCLFSVLLRDRNNYSHYAPQLLHGTSLAEKDYSLVTANKNKYYSRLGTN